jgi:hypothetical protein
MATLSELSEIVAFVGSFLSASSSGDGIKPGNSLISPIGSSLYRIRSLINLFTLTPVSRTDNSDAAGSIREPNGENPCALLIGSDTARDWLFVFPDL